jgi:hypothetical protein
MPARPFRHQRRTRLPAAAIGGFVPFAALKAADTTAIAQGIQAVGEPLSKVAGKVVNS